MSKKSHPGDGTFGKGEKGLLAGADGERPKLLTLAGQMIRALRAARTR